MRVLVRDRLVTVIAVPVVTVKVMERDLSELELALNLVLLKMNAQVKGKEQDLLHQEDEMMTETKKRIEITKGKEAKVVHALQIGVESPHQSLVQGPRAIVVDHDQEVILLDEDK